MTSDTEGFDALVQLALNLQWSWNHAADEIRKQIDPLIWETKIFVFCSRYFERKKEIKITEANVQASKMAVVF